MNLTRLQSSEGVRKSISVLLDKCPPWLRGTLGGSFPGAYDHPLAPSLSRRRIETEFFHAFPLAKGGLQGGALGSCNNRPVRRKKLARYFSASCLHLTAAVAVLQFILAGCLSPFCSSEEPSPPFLDAAESAGLKFLHQRGASDKKHLVETQGSGCAFLDYDSDGWLDILLINGGATPDSRVSEFRGHALYHNLGNGKFEDVTASSGINDNGSYGMGVAVGDYDNDGYPDIYITNFGSNVLYHNNRNGTFANVTGEAGVVCAGWSSSSAFLDFDNDGYLDLYVTRYVDYNYQRNPFCADRNIRTYCHPRNFGGVADKLYRNLGNGRFQDISETSGIANPEGKGLGVVAADFNSDGWTDIYVANDTTRNFLYRNNGNGTFTDVTLMSGTGYNSEGEAEAGMGVDVGDYNGDGRMDIVVTNYDLETNSLYRNDGDWLFSDERWQAGVAETDHFFLGFGTGFFDFDNDGDQDLLFVNGHVLDNAGLLLDGISYAQPLQLLENQDGKFRESLPFQRHASRAPSVGRGSCFGDIDNDGDLDVLINNSGQKPTLLLNQIGQQKSWILLKLIGTPSNRDAVGARITAVTEYGNQVAQIRGGRSYLSASDLRVHFGLGHARIVKNLTVRWPSGIEDAFENIKPNQMLSIREGISRSQTLQKR